MELAFLTAIQWLPGRQRAVLVLRDVLGWSAAEAADLLDASVPAVNSALQRARTTIERELGVRPVRGARAGEQALLQRYVDAWERADMDSLVALLREDAVLSMPPGPSVAGAAAVGAFLARVCGASRLVATATSANRQPAVAMWDGDELHRLVLLDVEGGRIAALHAFTPSPVSRG
jgi:RNA polymerase sigma-70 factor, ECF subfamily